MPQVQASITISGDPDQIFAETNSIERWPELFQEYTHARVLTSQRAGRFAKIEFELTNELGESWRSWRLLDYQERMAIAQRGAPLFPFLYMHLTWCYEPVENGVVMTWLQDFERDPGAPGTNEQFVARMQAHMQKNQAHFKYVLENTTHPVSNSK